MTTFKQLGLSDEVLKALSTLGFDTPTEIQEQSIPHLIEGQNDLIGLAHTGTGKTAAFGLPLLDRIDPNNNSTQALVLAPTRELGQQIADQLVQFSKFLKKVNVLAVYGGAAITNQIKALKKPQHVIIATPGRLIDLIKRKSVNLENLKYLVLDEADEMLNMGFKEELEKIMSFTPSTKLTWLFSATMPNEIKRIVDKYMRNPVEIGRSTKNEINSNIVHQFTVVRRDDKTEALIRFIDLQPEMHSVVFCRTKMDTDELAAALNRSNYKADAIHGDLTQKQRDLVMKRFKAHDLKLLIATDVAARGIDVQDLTHVFHFTIPEDVSYYTHRSGRTARAGKKGYSISFVNGRELGKIRHFERKLGISIEKIQIPQKEDITEKFLEEWCGDVLNKKTKGRLPVELLEKAELLFGNLSKSELLAKVLMKEYEKLNTASSKDLNVSPSDEKKEREKGSFKNNKPNFGRRKRKRKGENRKSEGGNFRGGRRKRR